MGCEHNSTKVLGISINCPTCAMDRVMEKYLQGKISFKIAWKALQIIKNGSTK